MKRCVVAAALWVWPLAAVADAPVQLAAYASDVDCGGYQTRGVLYEPSTRQVVCVTIEGRMRAIDTLTALVRWEVDLKETESAVMGHIWTPAGPSDELFALATSPTGNFFAVVSRLGVASIHRAADGAFVRRLQPVAESGCHNEFITVGFSPDGRHVIAGTLNDRICQWNAETGALVRAFDHAPALMFVTGFSADQRLLYAVSAQSITMWNALTGELTSRIEPPRPHPLGDVPTITAAAVSADGRYLAIGTLMGDAQNRQTFWQIVNLETGVNTRVRQADGVVYDVRFSADQSALRVFTLRTGWTDYDIVANQVVAQASAPDGAYFRETGSAFVWYGQIAWPWPVADDFRSAYSMDAAGHVRLWTFEEP